MAHYDSANVCERRHFWLGLPVVILTTLVGTSVFVSLQKETTFEVKVGVGVASVVAAILAGIQTFLRFSERAEEHRRAAARFGNLKREIEYRQTFSLTDDAALRDFADDLRKRWDKINNESPTASRRFFARDSDEGKQAK